MIQKNKVKFLIIPPEDLGYIKVILKNARLRKKNFAFLDIEGAPDKILKLSSFNEDESIKLVKVFRRIFKNREKYNIKVMAEKDEIYYLSEVLSERDYQRLKSKRKGE